MAEHFDGKGHHRKPRPYAPHNNLGLIKLARLAPLNALPLGSCDDELLETMVVEMGCSDSGKWYVDTSGCGILQANDANPPPSRNWLRNAIQCAAVFLLGLMFLTGPTSCNKDPQPTPNNPDVPGDTILPPTPPIDTIQPDTIVPDPGGDTITPEPGGTKEYIVDLLPGSGGWHCFPPVDSVRSWVPCYDTIILFVRAPDNAWTPIGFHAARDSLSKRFNISPKVRGGWWWTPYQILPDADSINHGIKGMIRSDSTQFANWGYGIYPQVSKNVKNVNP